MFNILRASQRRADLINIIVPSAASLPGSILWSNYLNMWRERENITRSG